MNATIEKIVSLLFEDLAETEEIAAIHEEILQNCQERYQDLREAGMGEDDAIHAVIESLSGMEEMLSEYPRKSADVMVIPSTHNADTDAAKNAGCAWSCDPAVSPIREIRMEHMGSANIQVVRSEDEQVHVECSNPELTLTTGLENGVLTVALGEESESMPFTLENGIDLKAIGRLFESIGKKFMKAFVNAEVTLALPASVCASLNIHTASGNVYVENLTFEQLLIGTASGDMELHGVQAKSIRLSSASGDAEICDANAAQMQLSSVSGDLTLHHSSANDMKLSSTSGDLTLHQTNAAQLQLSTISGDIEMDGIAKTISFSTVSGDAGLNLFGDLLYSLSGKTTSGDVEVRLPSQLQADIRCSSTAGDIHNHAGSVPGAPVSVSLSTVSGDIEIN